MADLISREAALDCFQLSEEMTMEYDSRHARKLLRELPAQTLTLDLTDKEAWRLLISSDVDGIRAEFVAILAERTNGGRS